MRRIFVLLLRLITATLCGVLYESYWFNKYHLFGYMWFINQFRLKEKQVEGEWTAMLQRYPPAWSVAANWCIACSLYFIYHTGIVRVRSIGWALLQAFCLSLLFYVSQLPVCFMTGLHWMPFLYNHVHTLFLLFVMSFPLTVHFPVSNIHK